MKAEIALVEKNEALLSLVGKITIPKYTKKNKID